jgi:phosphoribosylpyrophosphate synthetase
MANLITEAGANRVLACDLHSGQSMGYFDIPVDHVYGQVSEESKPCISVLGPETSVRNF